MVTTTFFAIPINVSAEETAEFSLGATSGITGDCTWKLDDEGTLTISGNGKMGNYYLVWGAPWERNIKSVIIEKGVTSIGSFAFYSCTSLTNLTISGSVTSIGDYAFSECTSLASVTIPDSVTSIGDDVFYDCTNLTSVTIGDSVTSIGHYAFWFCQRLSDVYYGGNETQWNKIEIGTGNDCLTSAVIHYNSFTGTSTPVNTNPGSSTHTGTLTPVNTNSGSSSQSNSVSVKTPNNSTLNV